MVALKVNDAINIRGSQWALDNHRPEFALHLLPKNDLKSLYNLAVQSCDHGLTDCVLHLLWLSSKLARRLLDWFELRQANCYCFSVLQFGCSSIAIDRFVQQSTFHHTFSIEPFPFHTHTRWQDIWLITKGSGSWKCTGNLKMQKLCERRGEMSSKVTHQHDNRFTE